MGKPVPGVRLIAGELLFVLTAGVSLSLVVSGVTDGEGLLSCRIGGVFEQEDSNNTSDENDASITRMSFFSFMRPFPYPHSPEK